MDKSKYPRYTARIPKNLLDKMEFIALYESRTKNGEIEYNLRKYVYNFERKHKFTIPIPFDDKLSIMEDLIMRRHEDTAARLSENYQISSLASKISSQIRTIAMELASNSFVDIDLEYGNNESEDEIASSSED